MATTSLAGGAQEAGHVSKDNFLVRVAIVEQVEVSQQRCGAEDVDAGVDFVNVLLGKCEGFLLDDGVDIGRARSYPNNAAIAGGVVGKGGQDCHGCFAATDETSRGSRWFQGG